jgi:lipoyl(octanoyl) transferase
VGGSVRASAEPLRTRWLGTVDYLAAWDLQREHAEARAAGFDDDVVLLLEHPYVYTAGRRTKPHERPTDGTPVIDVDRGGKITWHGPGQLVGYPIVGLAEPYDVIDYVRRLEQALIEVVHGFGIACGRIEGRSGVWLPADGRGPERKIASIGVRVRRAVTMHGFSINYDPDLAAFDRIIPCGIADAGVTSLAAELGSEMTVADVLPMIRRTVPATLEGSLPVTDCTLRPAAPVAPGVTFALDPAITR